MIIFVIVFQTVEIGKVRKRQKCVNDHNAQREHSTQSSMVTREWYSFEISKSTVVVTYIVHDYAQGHSVNTLV